MTVFHYPMFYLLIWNNQIFSLSFVFSFLPIAFICSQLYQRFGRKPITLGAFLPDKRKKTHDHRRVPDSVNTQKILFTEISSHTPLQGKKKIPNLYSPSGQKKDPEPFLVRDLSKSIFSFLPTNWDFFYSPVASRYSSVPTSLQACLPAMMTLPLAYSYAYISMICGSESPSLSVAD